MALRTLPVTVGIGVGTGAEKVLASISAVSPGIRVELFARPGTIPAGAAAVTVREGEEPEERLVRALMSGEIDAAVRGTLPASTTLALLKRAAGVPYLIRIALLETGDGRRFLLAPVGVDEGWTVAEKVEMVERGRELAALVGLPPTVAVLSGGRAGDLGRHEQVDRSLAEAEEVARIAGATHGEILIEDAVGRFGMVLAPDGISGNLIFRTLVLLGGGHGHGAPVVNIGRTFVDTSRATPDYARAINLAASLAKRKKST
ncbi:MAG: methanogenesis marker protein Mmp4/MtxX [Methanomicrobiales archaeon]|nr:methanogenesis marker protein Mmp4/MtxX [Methanomicrobiales archaeon]